MLTTRSTAKIRNVFANNMSTVVKISRPQISKLIQSGGCFGSMLANVSKEVITDLVIPLARDNVPKLVTNLASNTIINIKEKQV